ncbi:MAG TPA: hypothetical protein VK066_17420 [Chloroflexota bacterium]|nr:hypothetical protein [Chloroflexota bacterium]
MAQAPVVVLLGFALEQPPLDDAELAPVAVRRGVAAGPRQPGSLISAASRFPYSQTAVVVTRGSRAERTDLIRDFLRAHLEALGAAKRDPALAKRTLGKYMRVDDPEVLDRSYAQWKATLEEWAYPSLPAIQAVLDQRAPDHENARTANPSDFVDERLIRELDESGFLRTALRP